MSWFCREALAPHERKTPFERVGNVRPGDIGVIPRRRSPGTRFIEVPMATGGPAAPGCGSAYGRLFMGVGVTRRKSVKNRVLRCLSLAGSLGAVGLMRPPVPRVISLDSDRMRQELTAQETYRRQCAACHGVEGRGDGRAARRYNPRPPDFTAPEGVAKLSDDEVIQVIMNGRSSMPSFKDVLSEEAIVLLISYVRDLSRGEEGGGV